LSLWPAAAGGQQRLWLVFAGVTISVFALLFLESGIQAGNSCEVTPIPEHETLSMLTLRDQTAKSAHLSSRENPKRNGNKNAIKRVDNCK
jgi:hypothetical protein